MKQTRKKAKYLPYDYEATYQRAAENLEESTLLDLARKSGHALYATRRIDSCEPDDIVR